MPEEVSRPFRWSESCWEALPEFQEASGGLLVGWKCSRGPPRGPGGFRRPSKRDERGCEALAEGRDTPLGGREESGCPPKGLGGVRTPSCRAGRCCVALQEVQEGSVGPHGGPDGVRRPSCRVEGVKRPYRRVAGYSRGLVGVRRLPGMLGVARRHCWWLAVV